MSSYTNPRKLPRQARSRATVDAVIVATTQVLIDHGFERATTARIAERAGVSIGSLYQYFPNKAALIAALIKNHVDAVSQLTQQIVEHSATSTLKDGLKKIVRAGTSAHASNLPRF